MVIRFYFEENQLCAMSLDLFGYVNGSLIKKMNQEVYETDLQLPKNYKLMVEK